MKNITHGGELDYISSKYNLVKEHLVDFSSNINPLGVQKNIIDDLVLNLSSGNYDLILKYPDKDYRELRKAISLYTGAKDEHILVGNGSTELISLFINTINKNSGNNKNESIIIAPSYSEYEKELNIINSKFSYFPLLESEDFAINIDKLISKLDSKVNLLIFSNPNNPTGSLVTVDELDRLLSHCKSKNIAVMVDETYIEFTDNVNMTTAIPLTNKFDNLFVIRGTSKFYSMAGIRLGYGVSTYKEFLSMVEEHQNPWSVNHVASYLGERIFINGDFQQSTRDYIIREREKFFTEISNWKNCKIYKSHSNFLLVKLLREDFSSSEIYHHCLKLNMVIRDCSSFEYLDNSFLRFCIMREEDNSKLLVELKKLIEGE